MLHQATTRQAFQMRSGSLTGDPGSGGEVGHSRISQP
jgi:hypothetical protein